MKYTVKCSIMQSTDFKAMGMQDDKQCFHTFESMDCISNRIAISSHVTTKKLLNQNIVSYV